MSVYGIGIDVVEVARMAAAIQRHGESFLERLFTAAERSYCESQSFTAPHYAARFAAKEAASKALGTGIGSHAGWHDLEIIPLPNGAPQLRLHGPAAAYARDHAITSIHISLTHSRNYAAANAIASTSA